MTKWGTLFFTLSSLQCTFLLIQTPKKLKCDPSWVKLTLLPGFWRRDRQCEILLNRSQRVKLVLLEKWNVSQWRLLSGLLDLVVWKYRWWTLVGMDARLFSPEQRAMWATINTKETSSVLYHHHHGHSIFTLRWIDWVYYVCDCQHTWMLVAVAHKVG